MKRLIILCFSATTFTACATTPSPEKICSAEWITPRADKAVSRIEKKTSRAVKTLKRAGESFSKGKTPGMFTMMRLSSALEGLEYEFTDGPAMRDLKTLAKTCDNPDLITKAMRSVLVNQGVSDDVFDFIEALPLYQNLLQQNLHDISPLAAPKPV